MIRLVICFLSLLLAYPVYSDEVKDVKLNDDDHTREILSLGFCNIFVDLSQNNGQYDANISIENIKEDMVLLLFDKSYNKKELKKQAIVYDKKQFNIGKGDADVDKCDHLYSSTEILPSEKIDNLIRIHVTEGNVEKCRLPIYFSFFEKKKKTSLIHKEVIELHIEIEHKDNGELLQITSEADNLIDRIEKSVFCSNKNHRGSSAKQLISDFSNSIDRLKGRVRKILSDNNYNHQSQTYNQYMAVMSKLESIDFNGRTVSSCSNDRKRTPVPVTSGHKCKYCSMSISDLYRKLNNYCISLHNGKKTKAQIMPDVEALYNCAQKNTKRDRGNLMSGITKFYNEIKGK